MVTKRPTILSHKKSFPMKQTRPSMVPKYRNVQPGTVHRKVMGKGF